ncbi:hypothetical protein ANRL3_02792 [Anaerolineae bacterium]|nr:hypothetical protein ANRL3_02792 [Anaerolineae bacterium]
MNWGLVIRESIAIGMALSTVLTTMIVVSLMINKEMWLQDYPPDVKARWGPISEKAKRQHFVFAISFFGVLSGAMAYDIVRLELVLGTPPSFLAIFVSIVIVFALFNLVDAVIIDWLILLVLWPGLGALPGTEGMASYKDARRWTINLLKGFALAPLAGALVAGVVFFLR